MAVRRRVIGNDFHLFWPLYRVNTDPATGEQVKSPLDLTSESVSNIKIFLARASKLNWKQTNLYQIQTGEEGVNNMLDIVVKGSDKELQQEGFLNIKISFDELVDEYIDNVLQEDKVKAQRLATEEGVVKLVSTTQEALRDNSAAGFVDEDNIEVGGVITIQGYTFSANQYDVDIADGRVLQKDTLTDDPAKVPTSRVVKRYVDERTKVRYLTQEEYDALFASSSIDPDCEYNIYEEPEPTTNEYTIIADSANIEQGTVTGTGSYAENSVAELTANPAEGFVFSKWQDENTDNPRSIVVTADATFTAYFEEAPEVPEEVPEA